MEKNVEEVVQIALEVDMTTEEVMIVLNIDVVKEEMVEEEEVDEEVEVVKEEEVDEEVEVVKEEVDEEEVEVMKEEKVDKEVEVMKEEKVDKEVEVVGEVDEVVGEVDRYRSYETNILLCNICNKEEYIWFAENSEKAHTTLVVVYAPLSSKRGFWSMVLTSCWLY